MVRRFNKASARKSYEARQQIKLFLSELVENFFYLPIDGDLVQFSLRERPYFYQIYDEDHPNQLLLCGRQVGKSTALGNKLLAYSALVNYFRSLYVSPTNVQTIQFSNDRLRAPIDHSKLLSAMEDKAKVARITHKAFQPSGSEIRLRHAFLSADRIRGIASDLVTVDEIQDIIYELVPVIEETLFTSTYKYKLYAGTPKTTSNTIHHLWHQSTQCEWLVPCDRCAVNWKGGAGRAWNIMGEPNIGRKGPICKRCGGNINPRHPDARWVPRNPRPRSPSGEEILIPFHGYHVSQLLHPMKYRDWVQLLDKYQNYPRQQFYNEVLGLSYDSGLRPVTPAHIQACCSPNITMEPHAIAGCSQSLQEFKNWIRSGHPCFLGVDWGTSENSYTVATLGTYTNDGLFTFFYAKRFVGQDSEPDRQIAIIESLVHEFNVSKIGTDYGGGFDRNYQLVLRFGPARVAKYQYTNIKSMVEWVGKLGRFEANRTEVMSALFNAIRKGNVLRFPRWEEFEQPFGQDILNIYGEYNHIQDKTVYNVQPGETDDTFHSLIYCFLVSMLQVPRTDIFYPVQDRSMQYR